LVGLLCGSEGTLGIVTSALLQLVPAPQSITTILVGCRDVESAVALVTQLTQLSQGIEAAEMMLKSGVDLVEQAFGFQAPWPAAVYVLLDIDAEETHTDELLSAIATSSGVTETAIGSDSSSRQRLWRLRDEHTPAISTLGPPLKFDITIPISRIDHFIATVTELLVQRFAEVAVFIFGHIADGNLHVNISGVDEADVDKVVQLVLGLVSERQGSISAEHGIGTAKKAYLHLSRSATDIAAMRGIKGALDPDGIMNPNVLFVD
jgi:FAD/FMN-containing dehydrogenase